MKKNIILIICLILTVFLLVSCSRNFKTRVDTITFLEESDLASGTVSPERMNEIKTSVHDYEKILDSKVEAGKEVGNFYRLLATEFMNHEMFGLALDSFKEALEIYPSSFTLFYYAGVCSARMSLVSVDDSIRRDYLFQAETYYLRALQLNRRYSEVQYALAVLYFYEMEQPWKAEPILLELLENQPGDIDSLFLMGAVQAAMGNSDDAVYYYETIADVSDEQDVIEQAMENRNAILGGINE